MKTPLEIAREETRQALAHAERARAAAEKALQVVDASAPIPSGTIAMAVAAVQSAALAATGSSESAAHALQVVEAERDVPTPSLFEQACLAVSKSHRAAIEASQAAVAAMGVVTTLQPSPSPQTPGSPSIKHCAFCGRSEDAVRLVSGPQAHICEECVKLCARTLGIDGAE